MASCWSPVRLTVIFAAQLVELRFELRGLCELLQQRIRLGLLFGICGSLGFTALSSEGHGREHGSGGSTHAYHHVAASERLRRRERGRGGEEGEHDIWSREAEASEGQAESTLSRDNHYHG